MAVVVRDVLRVDGQHGGGLLMGDRARPASRYNNQVRDGCEWRDRGPRISESGRCQRPASGL